MREKNFSTKKTRVAMWGMPLFFTLCFFSIPTLFAQGDSTALAFLSVHALQEDLPVLINHKLVGKTPLRRFPLLAGQYEIIVQADTEASWFDEDWREQVSLRPGDSISVIARMRRGYRINSIPYGAEVWQADKLLGTTPYVLRLPENQSASLELRHPLYRAAQFEIGGRGEGLLHKRNFEIVLERNFDYAATQQHERSEEQARRVKHRKLAYLSAAVSLASGVGAGLLKREADAAYEQYLVTGEATAREAYFARAEKYDRYYSAAFALFEVSFAVSFYGFLKSLR